MQSKRAGMSLIEVLIILVIIGSIVTMFYSPSNERIRFANNYYASSKIYRDMNTLFEALNIYYVYNGHLPPLDNWKEELANTVTTADNIPVPPERAIVAGVTEYEYRLDVTTYYEWGGPGRTEAMLVLDNVKSAICKQFNDSYTGFYQNLEPEEFFIPMKPEPGEDQQCVGDTAGATILKPIVIDEYAR